MFSRLLYVLLIIVPCFTFAQVDLNKGLVAYYPFNGNANDASGNGNNAIFNNATLTTDYYGNANSAYHFNGVDNYIQIPISASLNTGNQISICAWVKPTGFYAGMCHGNSVLMKGDNDLEDGNYFVRFDDAFYTGTNCNGGLPDTIHQTFYGRGTGLSPAQDTPFAQKNIWRSLVYTYDGLHAKLYIDCKLILDSDIPGLSFTNASDLFFGRLNDSNFPYWFNGTMDEVRIFNRPIDSDEVKAYSFSCADKEPCSNWLKVNKEISGVQIGDLNVTGNQITVEAVINRTTPFDDLYNGGDVVSKHDNPSDANYLLRPTVAQITTSDGFFTTTAACDIKLNKTYHIAMVYNGKTLKFYRNGFLMSEVSASGNLFQNNWITKIGTTANVASPYPADFIGYINEVRIWNIARTQGEIQEYINQPLPNPETQIGLLAYYTFDDLKNKQGNTQWDGSILGDADINQTNPTCASFIADSCAIVNTIVTPGFNIPDTVCVGKPIQPVNTSQGASNYYWSFCAADFNTTPAALNTGNPNATLDAPVFMDYTQDDNGNYYGFISNYNYGHLIRLNYGNSLLNNPTAEDIGDFGGILPSFAEGVQVKKVNGQCYVFVVSAGNSDGTASVLIRIDFGNSFSNNNPAATNLGNVGGLNFPHDLFISQQGNNFYGFTVNINDNTITRIDFGNSLENSPTGTNLGNIGNLDYPCGLSFINTNGKWFAFITNRNSNSVSRLSFGNSLTNIPVGTNLGNPGNFLNRPRDVSLFQSCSGIVGLVVNEEDEQTGTITKLDFGSDLLSAPQASNLGNIGDLKFPHSISKFFLEKNDIYSFVTNVANNTITRLRYAGCTNSSIPSSTLQTPPSVTYSQPGVYNINLLVDVGLPTETSFCKQIVVKDCNNPCDSFKVDAGKDVSVCNGSSTQLNASGAITYNWNASSTLSDTTIANPLATPLTTSQFIVTGYDSAKTCSDKDTIIVHVNPLPVFKINNDTTICSGSAVQLNAMPGNSYKYHWSPYNYLSDTSISNPVSTPADSIIYFVTASDSNNCRSLDSITINVVPKPTVATLNDTSICLGSTVVLSSTSTNANRFIWSPATGLNNNSTESPQASPDSSTDYTISASNGFCSVQDSVIISVLSLPATSAGNDTTTCGTGAAHLLASGATFYTWSPSTGLSDTSIYNPVASPALTTTYYVTGKNSNGCIKTDSVTVRKQPDPVFNITPADSSICAGQKISLSASGGNVYSWSPAQAVSDSTSPNIYANPSFSTKYIVHISNSICKVSINLSAAVTVLPSPQVTISKSNDIDCSDLQAKLTATGGVTYNWQPNTDIDDPMSATPVVNPPADTRYTVTVTDSDQCVSRASITVNSTLGNVGFYVPTAFTPNGDGLNDCFGLRYWGTPATFNMMIYDKWGYPVFHSQNISDCWDGTIHGKKQGSGTYVYMITATSICGKGKVFRKGTVVLIR